MATKHLTLLLSFFFNIRQQIYNASYKNRNNLGITFNTFIKNRKLLSLIRIVLLAKSVLMRGNNMFSLRNEKQFSLPSYLQLCFNILKSFRLTLAI